MFRKHFHIIISFFLLSLTGCSIQPFIDDDQKLVDKNVVNINQDDSDQFKDPITAKEIKNKINLRPRANSKFLGTRLAQYIHLSLEQKEGESKSRDFIQNKFGQEPNYVDTALIYRSLERIENYLWNNGYFNGTATYSVKEKSEIASVINYDVTPNKQHIFGKAEFEFADSTIIKDILQDIKLKDYVKEGEAFSVTDLNQLRNAMVKNALENGYFDFNRNSIYIEPDTLRTERVADIYVVVDNQRDTLYNQKYYIRDIYLKLGQGIDDAYSDPVNYNEKDFSQSTKVNVKPKVLDRFILFEEGEQYTRTKHLNTINKLYDLEIVKYANIEFQRVDNNDSDSLFLDVFIDANAKNLMRYTLEPTISEFEGPALGLELGFEHRNIFGGGEVFDFSISGSLQSVNNAENDNQLFGTQTLAVEPRIIFPRLLAIENLYPDIYKNTINQRTTVGARYGFQNYVDLYRLESFSLSQVWEWQSSPHNKHALSLIDVSSIDTLSISSLYEDRIREFPTLGFSLEPRFILGSNYTYTYSNRLKRTEEQNYFNFSGTIDLSGQIAGLFSTSDETKIGDRVVSQYIRSLASITHHQPIKRDRNTMWVNHFQGGLALANGNSEYIPAVKQFFLGGASSMRAWRPRSIGPGNFEDENVAANRNVDQRGDIMLEYNSEFRYPVTRVFGLPLNGALFTDVGNIWSRNEPAIDEGGRQGAKISSDFYRELGIAAGTGLRLDIKNFLVVRTDFAWRLRDPALEIGERWVNNPFTFEKMQFQLGIGYPFEN